MFHADLGEQKEELTQSFSPEGVLLADLPNSVCFRRNWFAQLRTGVSVFLVRARKGIARASKRRHHYRKRGANRGPMAAKYECADRT
jgi:hypothetical protein